MRAARSSSLLLVGLLVGSCHAVAPGAGRVKSLTGLVAPLLPGAGLRLAVAGQVGGRRAEVLFDVSAQLSLVTTGCFDEALVGPMRLKVEGPLGGEEVRALTHVALARVGDFALMPFEASLVEERSCVLMLGNDWLRDVALKFSVAERRLELVPSRARDVWEKLPGGADAVGEVLALSRDPKHDWPMVAVRVVQGANKLTAAFVISTHERHSRVVEGPARSAGLKPGLELLSGLPVPEGLTLPKELDAVQGVAYERLELSPGVGVGAGTLGLTLGSQTHAPSGSLALDVLGTFNFVLDVPGGALVISRPKVTEREGKLECSLGGRRSQEACFELHQHPTDGGVALTATVWRPLKVGARLHLEILGSPGTCQLGLSFAPGEAGRSAQHLLPWGGLGNSLPECAERLSKASGVSFALYEDEPLQGCPGICAFVSDHRSGRQGCECQPGPLGLSIEAERKLLDVYRGLMERKPKSSAPESSDP